MADIFISYARADRDKIEKLASALEAEGYSVWWDRHIASGAEFSADIERELEAAKAVIVCWSEEGAKSRWVKDEATIAHRAGKLKTISLDGSEPPIGYMQFHSHGMSSWNGGRNEQQFVELKDALAAHLAGFGSNDGVEPKVAAPIAASANAPWTEKLLKPLPLAILGAVAIAVTAFVLVGSRDPKPAATPTAAADSPVTTGLPVAEVTEQSIAVLPFVALSTDEDDEFFGKGVAEELLNALAQFPELKVAARTSAFSFEGQNVDLREIGETLGVAHVLEGSVRRSGTRLRITAQLIRVSDGFHLWSETYERQLTDIFDIQDEIVAELSRVLQFRLGVGAGAGRAGQHDVDPKAYEEYLRGLDLWWRREDDALRRKAILAFRRATVLDPGFADGWSAYGVSMALSDRRNMPFLKAVDPQVEIERALLTALELSPDNVRALAGRVFSENSIAMADLHIDQAIAAAPNAAIVNYAAAIHYFAKADHSRAAATFDRALTLDPLNETVARVRRTALSGIGQYADVADESKRSAVCPRSACRVSHLSASYYGLIGAMMSGDEEEIRYWRDVFDTIADGLDADPNSDLAMRIQIIAEFADSYLGGETDPDFWESIDRVPVNDGVSPILWASILAHHGRIEIALDAIVQNQIDYAGAFTELQDFYVFLPGPFEPPEEMRRHPRYHELWARPGMAELAAARRANGAPWGLPLPIEEGTE